MKDGVPRMLPSEGYTYAENTCCLVTGTNDSHRRTTEMLKASKLELPTSRDILKYY